MKPPWLSGWGMALDANFEHALVIGVRETCGGRLWPWLTLWEHVFINLQSWVQLEMLPRSPSGAPAEYLYKVLILKHLGLIIVILCISLAWWTFLLRLLRCHHSTTLERDQCFSHPNYWGSHFWLSPIKFPKCWRG